MVGEDRFILSIIVYIERSYSMYNTEVEKEKRRVAGNKTRKTSLRIISVIFILGGLGNLCSIVLTVIPYFMALNGEYDVIVAFPVLMCLIRLVFVVACVWVSVSLWGRANRIKVDTIEVGGANLTSLNEEIK